MNKSTLIAVVVFAALAAAAVATLREKPERGITRISFASVDPATVDRVVITGPNPVELKKDGESWTVDGKRADATAVKTLLDTVKLVESAEVVTRNRDRFAELAVDDEKGTRVQTFSAGKPNADFVVGGSAAGGSNVRVNDNVYLVKRAYKGAFARDKAQWLDRKLFADTINDATRVEVKVTGHAPYALVKDGEDWKLEDASQLPPGFRFDRNAARSLASALVSAQAKDVLDSDPGDVTTGLGDGADMLVFHLASGDPRTLRIGAKKDDGSLYARASTRADLVTIPDHLAKSLRKPILELRDLSLMAFDAAAAKRLEIVKEKDRVVFAKDGDTWKLAESTQPAAADFTLDPMAITRRLSTVGSARAVADADTDAPAKTGLDKPSRKVNVTLADDRLVSLVFGNETKWENADAVYARGNADGKTYLVRPFARDNILGGLDTFAKREETSPLANIDPHALSNLPPEVRESLMKQLAEKKQKDELLKSLMQKQGKQ
jgi:hypothetical protein